VPLKFLAKDDLWKVFVSFFEAPSISRLLRCWERTSIFECIWTLITIHPSANILFIIIARYYVSQNCQRIFKLHNVPLMRKIREIWNEYCGDGIIMFIAWHMPFGSVHVFLVWRRIHQNLISGGHETTADSTSLWCYFFVCCQNKFLGVFLGFIDLFDPLQNPSNTSPTVRFSTLIHS